MPLNERKIIQIILEECKNLPERCDGYRSVVIETVTDIIQTERLHRVQATNVQQRITDKCSATAQFLVSQSKAARGGRK
jgi:hypothetical protein